MTSCLPRWAMKFSAFKGTILVPVYAEESLPSHILDESICNLWGVRLSYLGKWLNVLQTAKILIRRRILRHLS